MATITAAMVKELRTTTGAGMMDCKTALTENDGDMETSVDWLRTKGLASASVDAFWIQKTHQPQTVRQQRVRGCSTILLPA